MQLKQRTEAFVQLGLFIQRHLNAQHQPQEANLHLALNELIKSAKIYNGWFTHDNCLMAIQAIGNMLHENNLHAYTQELPQQNKEPKTVAIIAAGNIPMVCFHDVMSVLLSGHRLLLKMSSDDNVLLPFFLKLLCHYQPAFDDFIRFSDGKLTAFAAVIATGNNNSSGYFEHYFKNYPKIIRKNRSSIAVLSGHESSNDLKNLGKDIFSYYGLGCRSVSKLLVPENYSFDTFFESIFEYKSVIDNKKYANNYEYNRAIYLMNKAEFLDNNFLILKPDNQLHTPVSVMFYQKYKSPIEVQDYLLQNEKEIQCVVGQNYLPFGNSQCPVITDFADGVNTMEFLLNL